MAKYEDYLPGGKNDPNPQEEGLDTEVKEAQTKQEEREASTPAEDWEKRYKELERLNSQQAQTLGQYRKVIDEHITNPTPSSEPAPEESKPLTSDDLWDNPDEAISKAVANHPDVRKAKELQSRYEADALERSMAEFRDRHPDYEEIYMDPSFRSWVMENNTRQALAAAADNYDMNSADALFSLYKAEKGLQQKTSEQQEAEAINAATLEDSTAPMVEDEPKYSRSEFIQKKILAETGNSDAIDWVNRNVARYREALASGNVRD